MSTTRRQDVPLTPHDQQQVEELYVSMQRSRAQLVLADGRAVKLPPSLNEFLLDIVGALLEGRPVSIIQRDSELTTVQAAQMLGVSRQFLVNLLEDGRIAFHKVGSHRRVYARDLLAYKARRDQQRKEALTSLAKAESDEGLFELHDPDDLSQQ